MNQDFTKITPADGWGIDFPVDYMFTDGGRLAFGRPAKGGKYQCTERVVSAYNERMTRAFAFVEHPEHGLIAVSPPEFDALGLPEVIIES